MHQTLLSYGRAAVTTVALAVFAITGCQDGDDLLAVENPELELAQATATVNGQSIDGQTTRVGHNTGTVRFEAHLVDAGHPAPGHTVRVEYDVPGMGMMRRTGVLMLHDDGTHGDVTPRDGIYCYEDTSGEYGCHGSSAQVGEYHYSFCGIRENGTQSNHIEINTVLAQ